MQKTISNQGDYGRKPEVFYGYCYRIQGMRMMNVDDYLDNLKEGYSQIQAYSLGIYRAPATYRHGTSYDCGCGDDKHDYDSCCDCCICDGDVLIEARCSERRIVSLTFSNDGRRKRDVTLSLSSFTTASGRDLGWTASLSETKFQLGPCEEKVVQLVVNINCSAFNTGDNGSTASAGSDDAGNPRRQDVDRCEVAYARVSADGCISRPVVVAVAVLPNTCDSHSSSCNCACC
ncbi:MAG: hypothetical protein AAGK26_11490 [Pseudomonadota bacterium]